MCRSILAAGLALVLFSLVGWTNPAPASDGSSAAPPPCQAALGEVAAAFRHKESRFWNSNLQIVKFADIREIALNPWPAAVAARRFCSAEAQVSDGISRPVYFSLEAGMGFAGMGWGVQWCVVGLDRNWAYNPNCRMARP